MKSVGKKLSRVLILSFMIMTMSFSYALVATANSPLAAFDYRGQEALQGFYEKLDGEWQFFEKELLTPLEVSSALHKGKYETVTLPSSFEAQTGAVNTYGTYSTKILIPEQFVGKALAIYIPYQYSAYTLFADGVEIARNGVVGQDKVTHQSEMAPSIGYLFATSTEIELTMQVSSFQHIRGGLENTIYFGAAPTVAKSIIRQMNVALFINSGIFVIGLFTLSFASFRKEEKSFMVFGLFCLFISFRALFTEPFYYTILFPKISWLWGTRLEYLFTIASSWLFVILMRGWHEEFSKKITVFLSFVHFTLLVVTLFTHPVFFQALFFKVFYLAIFMLIYLIYIICLGIKNNSQSAKVNGVGIALIFIAFLNDFAIGNGWYQSWTLMLPAVGLYVLLHMVQMSMNFASLTRHREVLNEELLTLNASLDEKVNERTKALQEANKLLKEQAAVDSLTGIYNRRSFNEFIEAAFQKALQQEKPLAILMLDIDQFKKYNDYFGHIKGDWLLQEIVKVIGEQLSSDSYFTRYGGEEFSIILPSTSYEEAYDVAEKVRQAVEEAQFEHPTGKFGVITISIGIAVMTDSNMYRTDVELIDAADQRLYQAKQSGRNRVM